MYIHFFFRATMSLTNFDQDQAGPNQDEANNDFGTSSTVATPEEFVTKYGGKRVINKILIANNGIAGKSNLTNHFNFHVCLTFCLCPSLSPIFENLSQKASNKSCLICVKSEKYAF